MANINLRESVVESYWKSKGERFYKLIKWMEAMEGWTLDGEEEIKDILFGEFERAILDTQPENIIKNSSKFIESTQYMTIGRAIRIAQWINENFDEDVLNDLIQTSLENEALELFSERLKVLDNLNLLTKLFTPARIKEIKSLIQEMNFSENSF